MGFQPEKHHTLERLFETTHEDAWKLLFKGNEILPATDSYRGHYINHLANEVCYFRRIPYLIISRMMFEFIIAFSGLDGEGEADPVSGSAA